MTPKSIASTYSGQRVTVVGGLGFIGSTLARALVHGGAHVTVVDSMHPEHGGNRFNVADVAERLDIQVADAADAQAMRPHVRDRAVIFNLAGQVSHVDSMTNPAGDLVSNCGASLGVLEAIRLEGVMPKVVFTSTRQVYGRVERRPVDETHPLQPVDVNGIHKVAAEEYHRLYSEVYGIPCSILRLTNTYGPRQLLRHGRQGFVAWFVRLALLDQEILVFAPGTQLRDFCYVDDAVDAVLRTAIAPAPPYQVLNVGGAETMTLISFTSLLVRLADRGRVRLVDFPADRKRIDIGSIEVCDQRLRDQTGWRPVVGVEEGISRMLSYYLEHGRHYLEELA